MCGACEAAVGAGHRARLDGHELEAAVGVGRAAAEAAEARPSSGSSSRVVLGVGVAARPGSPARSRPGRRRTGVAVAVEDGPADPDRVRGRRRGDELVRAVVGQPDVQERPDGLRRGRQRAPRSCSSIGVASRPRSTMSNSIASAHSGTVASRSKRRDHALAVRSSRTELKIGSWANSGSPGKYIWVTSRGRERRAEQREVDVRRAPGVAWLFATGRRRA